MEVISQAVDFVVRYKWEFIVYIGIISLIYLNRKKFEFQGRIVALYRTKLGLKLMDSIAKRFPRTVIYLGYVGVAVGFLGMILIVGFLIYGLYNLIFVPSAPAVLSPVLPGIRIPGAQIYLPLFKGLISLFIVVVIHEFSHGVVARAHKIPVEHSGFVMFGPIPGAFVEPNEKKLTNAPRKAQLSVFAAGPWSNALSGGLVLLIMLFLIPPIEQNFAKDTGISFTNFINGSPAEKYLKENVTYVEFQGEPMKNYLDFQMIYTNGTNESGDKIYNFKVGDAITFSTETQDHQLILGEWPENHSQEQSGSGIPYVGFDENTIIEQHYENKGKWWMKLWRWTLGISHNYTINQFSVLMWVFILSFGLGMANLLPLGPVDGGRMFQSVMVKWFGKKLGNTIFAKVTLVVFAIVLILVFIPIIKAILF